MTEHASNWREVAGMRWLPAAVLVLCLVLSGTLCAWSVRTTAREARTAQERQTEAFAQALSGRIQSYMDTLPGLRVFGALRSAPSDMEFSRYVEAISLQRRFPGLALTFMADFVPGDSRRAYVDAVRADRSLTPGGHPGFDIRPPGQRQSYMVLRHNYPPNEPSFGYDLYDPAQQYRAAVDAAVAGGVYVATGPVLLARDRDTQGQPQLTSVVIRAAVYTSGQTPETPAERVQAVQGVVGVSFRTADLVRSVLPSELLRHAGLRIQDPQALAEGRNGLIFDSAWLASAPPQPSQAQAAEPATAITARIGVANRVWDIAVMPDGAPPVLEDATLWLAALGLALSASLAVMTHVLVQANVRAANLIHQGRGQLQAERENLQRSESRYRMLFTHSLDAVMRTVPNGTVLAANPAACALFRCTEEQLKAAPNHELIDYSDPRAAALRMERQGSGSAQGQVRLRRADGSLFEAEVTTSTYSETGPGGRLVSSVIVRDVTERRDMEVRLRESQKMESIGTLAGGVAHDFNNVLAAILGNVALARMGAAADPALQRNLELIQRAATRGRALVQQIMTFSRRSPPSRTAQPLQPLVEESLALLRATLPAGVQLKADLSPEPLYAVVDASQVQQVVLNLCTNAWQALHGQAGWVHLSLERVPGEGLGWARLRVQDNGSGMDEDTRLRVFEPFFTTKPVGQGTGLGLSVVHGIVNASGGTIELQSEPGAGARFDIRLPLADGPGEPPAVEVAAPGHGQGHGEHVLYVDDDEVVALTVQALLESAGYRVSRVASASMALEQVRAHPGDFDIVVTDYNMPTMSGVELAEAMKAVAPGLPVVITSGYVTEELKARARAAGVRAVLFKEYAFEQLGSVVQAVLTDSAPAAMGNAGLD